VGHHGKCTSPWLGTCASNIGRRSPRARTRVQAGCSKRAGAGAARSCCWPWQRTPSQTQRGSDIVGRSRSRWRWLPGSGAYAIKTTDTSGKTVYTTGAKGADLNCARWSYDGGDCAIESSSCDIHSQVSDCTGKSCWTNDTVNNEMKPSKTCNSKWNCRKFAYQAGACPSAGKPCPAKCAHGVCKDGNCAGRGSCRRARLVLEAPGVVPGSFGSVPSRFPSLAQTALPWCPNGACFATDRARQVRLRCDIARPGGLFAVCVAEPLAGLGR
jgi:hypothetical protein